MITIYSTPTCAYCHALKEYLRHKEVEFKDIDITKDSDGQKWVIEHTGQLAVPVTEIKGQIIIGFDRPQIEAILREHKLLK
jgi:glutaredoxin-like YruB-family protein